MSLGVSIFLLVVGAILTFAVDVTTSGFNLNTVGIILMIAGALGLVLSLLFWSSFSPYRRSRTVAGPDTVVEERRIERDLPYHRPGRDGWVLRLPAQAAGKAHVGRPGRAGLVTPDPGA